MKLATVHEMTCHIHILIAIFLVLSQAAVGEPRFRVRRSTSDEATTTTAAPPVAVKTVNYASKCRVKPELVYDATRNCRALCDL